MEYKYYIGDEEVFPLNADELKYNYEKKIESGVVFEKVLETSLIFSYQSGDFNFKDQEGIDKCTELEFRVDKICGINNLTWFEGIFALMEGEFDDNTCKFTIKPRIKRNILEDIDVNFLDEPTPVLEGGVSGVIAYVGAFSDRNYVQCRYFDKTILFVAQKSNPRINGIVSNFFQINPDGVFYLPGVTNYWQYMVFANLSDIQEPIPSNPSTIGIINFQELMDDLRVLFDVFWFIDTNYNLRVEHRIYFEGNIGLDLTQSNYSERLEGKTKYKYNTQELPKEETWRIQNHLQVTTLMYSGIARTKKTKNTKVYETRKINTDYIQRVYFGGSETGLFLFATDGGAGSGGIGIGYWRMLQALNLGNIRLLPTHLVQNLHTYERPSLYALFRNKWEAYNRVESGGIILNSIKPIQEYEEIEVPLCCGDTFNTEDKVLTDIGEGYLEKAVFEAKTNMLKLTLKYKVPECDGIEPDDLDGLALWLKYNDVQKTGIYVDQWNDSSGNNRHAVQGVAALRPEHYTSTTPNSIIFDGTTGTFLATPAFQLFPNKRGTIFILMHKDFAGPGSVGEIALISTNGGAGTFYDLSLDANNNFISVNDSVLLPQNYIYPQWPIGLFSVTRYTDIKMKTVQNSVPSYNNSVIIPNNQPSVNPVIIGTNAAIPVGAPGNAYICEIIIYDRELTDFEREKIEFYLVKKGIYKINIP